MDNIKNRMMKEPKISRTWLSGGNKNYPLAKSVLLAIPAEYAREYHLDQPTNVLVTPTEQGLLIKKLEVQ